MIKSKHLLDFMFCLVIVCLYLLACKSDDEKRAIPTADPNLPETVSMLVLADEMIVAFVPAFGKAL